MNAKQEQTGILLTAGAYLLWGFLPIYWKAVNHVSAGEILAHRIVWSFVFMLVLIALLGKWSTVLKECKAILTNKKQLIAVIFASIMITLNWLTFIWAVNSDHVLQASLGYYINPLISILLGILVLKETLTKRQLVSFILAGAGVLFLTVSYGVFPWVSLLLAMSFGLYGLFKKRLNVGAFASLTIETMFITPIAILYLLIIPENIFQANTFFTSSTLLLIGAGIVTAVPLLLFAGGARRIPLAMIGFLQYIAPTIMLVLGVFVYNETFTTAHLIAFSLIWIALINYMLSTYFPFRKRARE
ncbi:EamA family transporter RarD [Oceanobacillus sp. M65]|uniref:EamA family transporter RarD n=1 Tax=Oceanobacillus jordanicus TaxID=2867266 RepID=A0AAW5B2S1_9BACI|nr:EamA family transporter RarD [Oceanobacillus jordanicus]AVR00648.1 EamA family transporter [Oceanobacillus iheyensis]MCG3417858.1 EamA family transporter RarD [Oceanobacillus jordanicus]NAO99458.1 EamA family transporter RarD [Halomonas sp. MG34]